MTLWSDFLTNKKRGIHKWKHYFPIYERHFARFVNSSVTIMEIGCGGGGSLQMWKQYLGPHAQIIGIDIREECKKIEEDQISICIGSQSDLSFMAETVENLGIPDIVVDDGSHLQTDLIATFEFLYPKMPKNGVYLAEDVHTSYWSAVYQGGLRKPSTFVEYCKNRIDDLNADHTKGELQPGEFTRTTHSICFYDSVVVFERGLTINKGALMKP